MTYGIAHSNNNKSVHYLECSLYMQLNGFCTVVGETFFDLHTHLKFKNTCMYSNVNFFFFEGSHLYFSVALQVVVVVEMLQFC